MTDYDATNIISQHDRETIVNEVNIVFNVLATIKFNESLYDAVNINILNTQRVVKIVWEIKNLKSFVHVSTLFSNSNRRDNLVDEKIYDHPMSYKQLIALADLTKVTENQESAKLVFNHDFPNTYTLTKHFAEKLVYDQADQLPAGIFRPPVVGSSYKNVPGWTDNLNGILPYFFIYSLGVGHCWLGEETNPSNMAPVDYSISAMVAAAWDISKKFEKARASSFQFSMPIYNYIFNENNVTYRAMFDLNPLGFHTPLDQSIYYYSVITTKYEAVFTFVHTLFTIIPAYLMDTYASLRGRKTKQMRTVRKIEEYFDITNFFVTTKFKFGNENVIQLLEVAKNSGDDLEFDMRKIDWHEYFYNLLPGIKQYFLKEDMSNTSKAVTRYTRLKYVHNIIKIVFFGILVSASFNPIGSIVKYIYDLPILRALKTKLNSV